MAILIKTPEQIEGIRKASQLTYEAIKYLGQFAQAGTTTADIDKKCREYVNDHGAKSASLGYRGFPASCCTSVNDVICHGVPGPYELRDGDILNIDVALIVNGFYGDSCRMFEVGHCSDYAKRLIAVAKECLSIGIMQCNPGSRLSNIGYEINRYATSQGCTVVYEFCGHGVGIKYHEDPEVNHAEHERNKGPVLQPGMIFTIEPMINAGKARSKVDRKDGWTARTIDGKLSAQFEHTILITDTIPDILTDGYGEFEKP